MQLFYTSMDSATEKKDFAIPVWRQSQGGTWGHKEQQPPPKNNPGLEAHFYLGFQRQKLLKSDKYK